MRILRRMVVPLGLLLLFSCAPKPVDMTALRKTIDEYNEASKVVMMTGTSDKIMAYYAEDAMEMAPNMALVKGKEAIKAFQVEMAKSMAASGMKVNSVAFTTTKLEAGGAVAYETGTYDMTMTIPAMGVMNDKGKYISLLKQQADGAWKMQAEMWSSDSAPPAMPETKEKGKK